MSTEGAAVVRCTEDDESAVVATLTAAFQDDPTFQYVFPDPERRRAGLVHVQRLGVRVALRHGEVFASPGRDAAAVWLPPGEHHVSDARLLAAGMAQALFQVGFGAAARLKRLMEYLDSVHDQDMPAPHWYLFILGTRPEARGRGLASALLAPQLARADAERIPCFLNTMNPDNLAFYQRHGFQVVRDDDRPGLRFWNLRRDPVDRR